MTAQPDLFPPPSGPKSTIPAIEANTYRAYLKWRETLEGRRAFALCARAALCECRAGAKRISAKGICEQVRHTDNIKINNTHVSWIADSLIASYPELKDVIETRARRKAKTL